MRKDIVAVSVLILLTAVGTGQTYIEPGNDTGGVSAGGEPQICGDGECSSIESGVCPEDCGGPYRNFSDEETESVESQSSPETNFLEEDRTVIAGSALVVIISVVLAVFIRRNG